MSNMTLHLKSCILFMLSAYNRSYASWQNNFCTENLLYFQLCDEIKIKSEDILKNLRPTDATNRADRVSLNEESENQIDNAKIPINDSDAKLNQKLLAEPQGSPKSESVYTPSIESTSKMEVAETVKPAVETNEDNKNSSVPIENSS